MTALESALLRLFVRVGWVSMRFETDSDCDGARINRSDDEAVLCLPTPP